MCFAVLTKLKNLICPGIFFFWEHAGKRVLCYRVKYHYTAGRTLEAIKSSFAKAVQDPELEEGDVCYFFWSQRPRRRPDKSRN